MGIYPEYARMLEKGLYDSVEELCNDLGLNYDEVYDYSDLENDDEKNSEDDNGYDYYGNKL